MFRHNLLISIRNFKRSKTSFFINLVGLSTGLTCVMLIYLWVDNELNMNKFHVKDHRLYQAMEHQQYADEIMTTTSTPGILAETLVEEIPEVEYAATTTWIGDYTLSVDDHNVNANGYDVGIDYFDIFSYNLMQGDLNQVLADKNSIVVSEELANKLYNTIDVLGKPVVLQHDETYLISGVFENIPATSSFQFDFVLSFEKYKDNNEWTQSWNNNGPSTYAVLREGSDVDAVNKKIVDFVKSRGEQNNVKLFLKKYSTQYLYGRFENGVQSGGRIEYVRLFSVIAVFILIIACINFMNLSTARATRRAREVGIKKAAGARRGSLFGQFISESLLITVISLIIAWMMVWAFLPQFNQVTGKQIIMHIGDYRMILWFMGITLFTGLIAGSYPALYLSGFKPIVILKGEVKGSFGELMARKGLVVFQFTMSVILIVAVMVVYKQIQYVQNKNLGYNKDNVIYFAAEGRIEGTSMNTVITEIKKIPGVINASSISQIMIGRQSNTSGLNWEGKDPDTKILFENVRINYDLIETLNIHMAEGRSFSREFSTDTAKIILNEAAIRIMGYQDDPIGRVISLWDEFDMEIIGVVKDFHFQSLHSAVNPLFMRLMPEDTWNVMVKLESGMEKETLGHIKEFYENYNPGFTFDYRFMDDQYQQQYAAEQRVAKLSRYFAGLAILISCLGLFGLAAFTAERRIKEIGIRKAMGSSATNILFLLTKDFTKLVILSIIIALPVSYLFVRSWLDRFAFKIELGIWFFIGAGVIALLIAWITVGSQAMKAANVNPADCLRDE